jgi:hypothetical protein
MYCDIYARWYKTNTQKTSPYIRVSIDTSGVFYKALLADTYAVLEQLQFNPVWRRVRIPPP